MWMVVDGQKSGKIKGGATSKGNEAKIELSGLNGEVMSPRDPQSGLPTGRRMHKPLYVAYKLDKSVPLMWQILATNENCKTVEVDVWQSAHKGSQAHSAGQGMQKTYVIKLTNANIAVMEQQTIENGQVFVIIGFTYQKIEWTWVDGGITAEDDWEVRVG